MDYSKMSDQEINAAVARVAGIHFDECGPCYFDYSMTGSPYSDGEPIRIDFDPCNNAADAWPIITENKISIILDNPTMPCATANARDLFDDADPIVSVVYDKPLRAAMLVYLQLQEAK